MSRSPRVSGQTGALAGYKQRRDLRHPPCSRLRRRAIRAAESCALPTCAQRTILRRLPRWHVDIDVCLRLHPCPGVVKAVGAKVEASRSPRDGSQFLLRQFFGIAIGAEGAQNAGERPTAPSQPPPAKMPVRTRRDAAVSRCCWLIRSHNDSGAADRRQLASQFLLKPQISHYFFLCYSCKARKPALQHLMRPVQP